jgi:hypothetical protein
MLPAPQAEPEGIGGDYQETDPDSGLSLGTAISGTPGSGKTTLATVLALWGLLKGYGQVLIDPTGSLSTAFLHQVLCFLSEFPDGEDELLWQRVRYIPIGAKEKDSATPFPIYDRREGESVWDASERLLRTLELSRPTLVTQSSVTWPRARRLASNAGAVLTSLGFQLTELEDLLFNTLEFENRGLFETAINRCPEVAPAVSYFREQYLPLSRSDKHSLTSTFLDHVYRFSQDPSLQLLFGGSQGMDLEETLETERETVILDCSTITDPEVRRFALLWIFHGSLYPHIKARGRRPYPYPLGLLIDELPALAHKAAEGANPLADLMDEFCARYMRANQVFFSCCFQSLNQLPPELQQTILRFGTLFVGRAGTLSEAKIWADEVLFRKDPMVVKHQRKVWGKLDPLPYFGRYTASAYTPPFPTFHNYFILDYEPEYMPLSEQTELAAQRIVSLDRFAFLVRPATAEGSVSKSVGKITLSTVTEDPGTKKAVFPDETRITWLKSRLTKRSGIPASTIRKEIASRLAEGTIQKPPQRTPVPRRLADVPPAPDKAKTDPSLPSLDEQQKAFLAFLSEHPDLPISQVYKGVGVSVRKGNEIRDSLKALGFLVELELRTTSPNGGRPMKCVLPGFQAFALWGIDPPPGRGGVIHRHIQQLVADGARAKGYTAKLEHELGNGAIVDVHLEKGGERIAVEIAVLSTPQREISHLKQCLAAGYATVYTLFADEKLLEKTATALQETCAQEEKGRVRFLPVGKLAVITGS